MLVNSRPPAQCPLTIPKLDKENLQAAAAASTDEAEPSPPLPQTPSLCGSEDSWAESPLPVSPVLDQQVVLPLAIDLDAEPATDEEVQSYYSPTFGKNIDDLFDKVLGSSLQPDAAGLQKDEESCPFDPPPRLRLRLDDPSPPLNGGRPLRRNSTSSCRINMLGLTGIEGLANTSAPDIVLSQSSPCPEQDMPFEDFCRRFDPQKLMSPDVFAEEWHAAFSRVHRSQSNCYPLGTATEDFEFCDVMDDLALLGLSSSDEIDGAFGQSDWDEEYNWNIGC